MCIVLLMTCLCASAESIKVAQIAGINLKIESEETVLIRKLNRFVQQINESDVDVVVFTGDVIANSKKDEFKKFCEIIKNLKKPYYIALGENDVHKINGIAKDDFMRYWTYKNPNQNTESPNYSFTPKKDIAFVILDGASPVAKSLHGYYSDATAKWLDTTLNKNKTKKVVIFQHFPTVYPEEKYSYTTLEDEKYNEVIKKHDNIGAIISAHYNKDAIIEKNGITYISTQDFNNDYKYRILDIKYDKKMKKSDSTFDIKTELVKVY